MPGADLAQLRAGSCGRLILHWEQLLKLVLLGQASGWPDVSNCRCFSTAAWLSQMLHYQPVLLSLLQQHPCSQMGMKSWKLRTSKLVTADWQLLTIVAGFRSRWRFKWTPVLWCWAVGCSCRTEKWVLVFRDHPVCPLGIQDLCPCWKLEVSALDVDMGKEWDGRGWKRPKLFLILIEYRLNATWPLHLNG